MQYKIATNILCNFQVTGDKTFGDLVKMKQRLQKVMSKDHKKLAKENVALLVNQKVILPNTSSAREGKVFKVENVDEFTEEIAVMGNRVMREALQAVDNIYNFSQILINHYTVVKNDTAVKERLDSIASRIRKVQLLT